MKLPDKRCKAETGWPDQATWLIYGSPKVGKTTFASQWPDCLILNTEPRGTRYIEGAFVLEVGSRVDLLEAHKLLKAGYDSTDPGKKPPYQTIAIDTIDAPSDWICQKVMEEMGTQMMGQATGGADWITARQRVISLVRLFSNLPVNLLILAHAKPIEIEGKRLGATVNLFNSLAFALLGEVENILYCTTEKDKRKLKFVPVSGTDMGSHLPALNEAKECELNYKALRALVK